MNDVMGAKVGGLSSRAAVTCSGGCRGPGEGCSGKNWGGLLVSRVKLLSEVPG